MLLYAGLWMATRALAGVVGSRRARAPEGARQMESAAGLASALVALCLALCLAALGAFALYVAALRVSV